MTLAQKLLMSCVLVALSACRGTPVTRDLDGHRLLPFAPAGRANVLLFLSTDCPMSNSYAPEVQRICGTYAGKGVACSLWYEDLAVDAAAVRRHLSDYRYQGIPAAIDGDRHVATRARASVTPQAVVVDEDGTIRYRGRIDNLYSSVGQRRYRATEHDLADALDDVLAGRVVRRPETGVLGCSIVSPDLLREPL